MEIPYKDKHHWAIERMKNLSFARHISDDVRIKRAAIASTLERLRADRNDADYESNLDKPPMRFATSVLKQAKLGIEKLEELQV
jgi:hypothetical protein